MPDSFGRAVNMALGRGDGEVVERLAGIRGLCEEFGVKFKINTVINALNWKEDMNGPIGALRPFKWKCFQL